MTPQRVPREDLQQTLEKVFAAGTWTIRFLDAHEFNACINDPSDLQPGSSYACSPDPDQAPRQ